MDTDTARLRKAVRRNLAEANNAILKRRALIGLHSTNSAHTLDFFTIVSQALYNDILAHAMRLFDRNSQSASFWYVLRCEDTFVQAAAKRRDISLDKLSDLAARFKFIRDQTHFHIDREAVLDPPQVWSRAGITGNELGWALESAYDLLADVQFELVGERPVLPEYDGSDASKIVRAYKAQHPEVQIVV